MFKKKEASLTNNPFNNYNERFEFLLGLGVLLVFLTGFCYLTTSFYNLIVNTIVSFIG